MQTAAPAKRIALLEVVGLKTRALRVRNRMTRRSLGEQIGLTTFRVDQLENGQLDIDVLRVFKMALLFDVSVASFMKVAAVVPKLIR